MRRIAAGSPLRSEHLHEARGEALAGSEDCVGRSAAPTHRPTASVGTPSAIDAHPERELPPRRPGCCAERCRHRRRRAFCATSLHDDVGPLGTTIGVVEQPFEERRRESERWVRNHSVGRAKGGGRSAGPRITRTESTTPARSIAARSRSTHAVALTAQTSTPAIASGTVSAPAPAPTSTTRAPGTRSSPATNREISDRSARKFWPSERRRTSRSLRRPCPLSPRTSPMNIRPR